MTYTIKRLIAVPHRLHVMAGVQGDIEIEACGFTDQALKEFISHNVGCERRSVDRHPVTHQIKSNALLWDLAHIPVCAKMMCHLFNDRIAMAGAGAVAARLPEREMSVSAVYEKMVKLMGLRYCRLKKINMTMLTADEYERVTGPVFNTLEGVAYKAMCEGRLILTGDEIINWAFEQGMFVGIHGEFTPSNQMFVINRLMGMDVITQIGGDEKEIGKRKFKFIHLTMQDYFGARYVVKELHSERPEVMKWLKDNRYTPRLEVMWWFIAGISREREATVPGTMEKVSELLLQEPRDLGGGWEMRLWVKMAQEGRWIEEIAGGLSGIAQMSSEIIETVKKEVIVGDYRCRPLWWATFKEDCRTVYRELFLKVRDLSEWLNSGLRDSNWDVQMSALDVLKGLGEEALGHKWIVEWLKSGLNQSEFSALSTAQDVLKDIGEAVLKHDWIVKWLNSRLRDSDTDVRRYALDMLYGMGEEVLKHEEIVERLISGVKDSDFKVQKATLEVLYGMREEVLKHEGIVEALKSGLMDSDQAVRIDVMFVLGRMGREALKHEWIMEGLKRGLSDSNRDVRRSAVDMLHGMGDEALKHDWIVEGLISGLSDSDWDVRRSAVAVLTRVGNEKLVHKEIVKWLKIMLCDTYLGFRITALEVLNIMRKEVLHHKEIMEGLISGLNDPHIDVRVLALGVLHGMGDEVLNHESIVEWLKSRLSYRGFEVRLSVLKGMGEAALKHDWIVEWLKSGLMHFDTNVQLSALSLLKGMGDEALKHDWIEKGLKSGLRHHDIKVRFSALGVLQGMGEESLKHDWIVEGLRFGLGWESIDAQNSALHMLKDMGESVLKHDWIVGSLKSWLRDFSVFVRISAKSFVKNLHKTIGNEKGMRLCNSVFTDLILIEEFSRQGFSLILEGSQFTLIGKNGELTQELSEEQIEVVNRLKAR